MASLGVGTARIQIGEMNNSVGNMQTRDKTETVEQTMLGNSRVLHLVIGLEVSVWRSGRDTCCLEENPIYLFWLPTEAHIRHAWPVWAFI